MDDLKGILLEGETVLWSGSPDWAHAEEPKKGWRAKAGAIKFAAIMLFAFLVMMAFGMLVDPQGFASGMLGVLIVLSAISFVTAVVNIVATDNPVRVRHDHVYAVTDARVIIHDRSKETTTSVLGPVLLEVSTVRNGETKNLNIRFTHGDDDFAILYALADADAPERLLIKNFSRRKAEQ